MRRFFVPLLNEPFERFAIDLEQTRHLQRVLRLRIGDEIIVFDGIGNEFHCVIEEFQDRTTSVKVIEKIEPASPESNLHLTLAVALIKGDKFDLVVQKAVELGMSKVIPVVTMRSDVKPKNVEKKLERWRKIIVEASKQCGRATLMEINAPMGFDDFAETADNTKILFAEKNGDSFSKVKSDKKITAVIGPEGGWDDSEIETARKNGFEIVTLGGRTLRAETAAISIATLLQSQFGDLN